jgi:hypothetical protein
MTQSQPSLTLFESIQSAVGCDDIEQACHIIQTLLGVCGGGLAALHFPELSDPFATASTPWKCLPAQDRIDRITDYIVAELNVMDRAPDSKTLSIRGFRHLQTGTDRMVLAHHVPHGGVWRITAKDSASVPCHGDRICVDHLDTDGETLLFSAEYDWSSFNPKALLARVAAAYGPLTFG